jgi:hypothetical protein
MARKDIQYYYQEFCPKQKSVVAITFDELKSKLCHRCGKCGGVSHYIGRIITKGQVVIMEEEPIW